MGIWGDVISRIWHLATLASPTEVRWIQSGHEESTMEDAVKQISIGVLLQRGASCSEAARREDGVMIHLGGAKGSRKLLDSWSRGVGKMFCGIAHANIRGGGTFVWLEPVQDR